MPGEVLRVDHVAAALAVREAACEDLIKIGLVAEPIEDDRPGIKVNRGSLPQPQDPRANAQSE